MLKVLVLPEVDDTVHVHTCAPPQHLHSIYANSTGLVIVMTLSTIVEIFSHKRTYLDGMKPGIPLLSLLHFQFKLC